MGGRGPMRGDPRGMGRGRGRGRAGYPRAGGPLMERGDRGQHGEWICYETSKFFGSWVKRIRLVA